jgi:hypothetical protein
MTSALSIAALKRGVMVSAPILLVAFSLLHGADELVAHGGPPEPDEWLRYLSTIQERWLALHVTGLALFPLLGLVVLWMLPADGTASRVSRVALAAYIVLYPAFDALVGIGSHILIQYRQSLSPADRPVIDTVIKDLFYDQSGIAFKLAAAGSITWGVGLIAAAVGLWRGRRWPVALPLAVAGVAMSVNHAPPFGTLTAIMLGAAVWQFLTHADQAPVWVRIRSDGVRSPA